MNPSTSSKTMEDDFVVVGAKDDRPRCPSSLDGNALPPDSPVTHDAIRDLETRMQAMVNATVARAVGAGVVQCSAALEENFKETLQDSDARMAAALAASAFKQAALEVKLAEVAAENCTLERKLHELAAAHLDMEAALTKATTELDAKTATHDRQLETLAADIKIQADALASDVDNKNQLEALAFDAKEQVAALTSDNKAQFEALADAVKTQTENAVAAAVEVHDGQCERKLQEAIKYSEDAVATLLAEYDTTHECEQKLQKAIKDSEEAASAKYASTTRVAEVEEGLKSTCSRLETQSTEALKDAEARMLAKITAVDKAATGTQQRVIDLGEEFDYLEVLSDKTQAEVVAISLALTGGTIPPMDTEQYRIVLHWLTEFQRNSGCPGVRGGVTRYIKGVTEELGSCRDYYADIFTHSLDDSA